MEIFVNKVCAGGGTIFDPMLEEKGGWIEGGTRQDEEMTEVVIGYVAETSHDAEKGSFNPFRAQKGEILPSNVERNFNGFFVRKEAITFKVDTKKLLSRIVELKEQLVIAKFVGPKPNPKVLDIWIQKLNQKLKSSNLSFCKNVGK